MWAEQHLLCFHSLSQYYTFRGTSLGSHWKVKVPELDEKLLFFATMNTA